MPYVFRSSANVAAGLLLLVYSNSVLAESQLEIAQVRALADQHVAQSGGRMLAEFGEFLSLPNVASNQSDMFRNAQWIERYLQPWGFQSEVVSAGTGYYVLAERQVKNAERTVLIYAHFDGQPVAAWNWATPPFEPTLKDGETVLDWDEALAGTLDPEWRIFARSAGDDKAPVIALIHAIQALEAAGEAPRVNVKLVLDGEEEAGSPNLKLLLDQHAQALAADVMLFCDGPMHQSRRRQLVFGVRGSMTLDLTAYGASRPLHSGHYGNWAPHPNDTLMRLLVSMKDEDGFITVPGYLDEVKPLSEAEREAITNMPRVDELLRDELALGRVEGGGQRIERSIMNPAIVVKGLQGGGVGTQSRNIIQPTASASLNLRLVAGQTVAGVRAVLEDYFRSQGFALAYQEPSAYFRRTHEKVLKLDWRPGAYPAFRSSMEDPYAQALAHILTELDGRPPLKTPTLGGSLPIYLFEQAIDMPIIILPVANHDNNQHGRDENLRLANLFDAIAVYAAVLTAL